MLTDEDCHLVLSRGVLTRMDSSRSQIDCKVISGGSTFDCCENGGQAVSGVILCGYARIAYQGRGNGRLQFGVSLLNDRLIARSQPRGLG